MNQAAPKSGDANTEKTTATNPAEHPELLAYTPEQAKVLRELTAARGAQGAGHLNDLQIDGKQFGHDVVVDKKQQGTVVERDRVSQDGSSIVEKFGNGKAETETIYDKNHHRTESLKVDEQGHRTSDTKYNPDGSSHTEKFDTNGKVIGREDRDKSGKVWQKQTIDSEGNKTTTTDLGGTIQTSVENKDGSWHSESRNANGRSTESVDKDGHEHYRDYDKEGHLRAKGDSGKDGSYRLTSYDKDGHKTETLDTDSKKNTTLTQYDAEGHAKNVEHRDAQGNLTSTDDYDADGKTSTTYDKHGKRHGSKHYRTDGSLDNETSYDSQERQIDDRDYGPDGKTVTNETKNVYHKDQTSTETNTRNGKVVDVTEYNKDRQPTFETSTGDDGGSYQRVYTYDENGQQTGWRPAEANEKGPHEK